MVRQAALWILALVLLAGVGIRMYDLTARSLWFDEAFSWRLIQFPFTEMIDRAAADVHPPLYYVVLRGWSVVFGSSILSLRVFSVTMAALAIAIAYGFTAYASGSRSTGLFAAALLAVSGWQVAFAWEARMYTLGMCFALASTWALLRAIRKPTLGAWLGYGLLAALFAYTHYFAFFTLAAHALFVLGVLIVRTRWRVGEILTSHTFWYAVMAAVVAVALYAPWLPVFVKQNAQVQASYWVPPIGGWSIPDTFYRMVWPTPDIPPHTWPLLLVAALPLAGAGLLWLLLTILPKHRDANILVLLGGLIPFLLAILISFVGQSLYQDRFLAFASLFLWIGIALLVGYLPTQARRVAMVVIVLFSCIATVRYFRELNIPSKPGAQGATAYVEQRINANEPLVVTSVFIFFSIDHYMQETYGKPERAKLYSETGQFSHFSGGPILQQKDVIGPSVFATTQSAIWVVDTTGFGSTKLTVPSGWTAVDTAQFPELYGYQGEVFATKYQRVGVGVGAGS